MISSTHFRLFVFIGLLLICARIVSESLSEVSWEPTDPIRSDRSFPLWSITVGSVQSIEKPLHSSSSSVVCRSAFTSLLCPKFIPVDGKMTLRNAINPSSSSPHSSFHDPNKTSNTFLMGSAHVGVPFPGSVLGGPVAINVTRPVASKLSYRQYLGISYEPWSGITPRPWRSAAKRAEPFSAQRPATWTCYPERNAQRDVRDKADTENSTIGIDVKYCYNTSYSYDQPDTRCQLPLESDVVNFGVKARQRFTMRGAPGRLKCLEQSFEAFEKSKEIISVVVWNMWKPTNMGAVVPRSSLYHNLLEHVASLPWISLRVIDCRVQNPWNTPAQRQVAREALQPCINATTAADKAVIVIANQDVPNMANCAVGAAQDMGIPVRIVLLGGNEQCRHSHKRSWRQKLSNATLVMKTIFQSGYRGVEYFDNRTTFFMPLAPDMSFIDPVTGLTMISSKPLAQRRYLFSFIATVSTSDERAKILEILQTLPMWVLTKGFVQVMAKVRSFDEHSSLANRSEILRELVAEAQSPASINATESKIRLLPSEFADIMADSVFVLCPAGHNPETHRMWEAIMMGALPITRYHGDGVNFERCGGAMANLLYAAAPWPTLSSWSLLPAVLEDAARNRTSFETAQQRLLSWRHDYLAEIYSPVVRAVSLCDWTPPPELRQ